jgi:hypothetical protein
MSNTDIEFMKEFRDGYFSVVGSAFSGLASAMRLSPAGYLRAMAPGVEAASAYFTAQQAAFNQADALGQENIARGMSRALFASASTYAAALRASPYLVSGLESIVTRTALSISSEILFASVLASPLAGVIIAALIFSVAYYFIDKFGADISKNIFDETIKAGHWLGDLFGHVIQAIDPLVLDLDGGGVSLSALAGSNVYFDLNVNNYAERTGWVSAGDGLLALDANRNGAIDNGSELFGNRYQNGFDALRVYDDNKDGQITSADAVWGKLLIWRDANGDGVSAPAELTAIAASNVAAISLNAKPPVYSDDRTRSGNAVQAIGNYTDATGQSSEAIAVGFSTNQSDTRYIIPEGFAYDPEVFVLPNLRGYGSVPDLWVAMSLDPVLKGMVQAIVAGAEAGDYDDIRDLAGSPFVESSPGYINRYGNTVRGTTSYSYQASAFDDMLARWAGIAINPGRYDANQMSALAEKLLGRLYEWDYTSTTYTKYDACERQNKAANENLNVSEGVMAAWVM